MPKLFIEAFEEWKRDNRYSIGEDVGWEFFDNKEASPTLAQSSSTLDDKNGNKNPA